MATIRKRGEQYHVQIRRKGQPSRTCSFLLLDDARRWARQIEAEADRAPLPDVKELERITLRQLVERYRDEISPRKRGGEIERIVFNAFLRDYPVLCAKPLSLLAPKDFADWRDQRLKKVRPNTLKRELAPLHNLFEVARWEWGLPIQSNPVGRIKIEGAGSRRERRLREGEFDKLLKAAADCRNDSLMARIIVFAVETGMRRGEILAIRWEHVDWSEPCLLISHTKNDQARTIPLSPRAVAVLTPSTNPRAFPITANAFRLAWERLCERAGIDDLHFHDLRHEAISRFFEMGLTVPEVALVSGHRDMRMLFRYTHPARAAIGKKLR